jgi:ELWxxDGT repeat protein
MSTRIRLAVAAALLAPVASAQNTPYLVADINAGLGSSSPEELTVVGNQLFFIADDGTNGRQLWVSDGTGPGTTLVELIVPPTYVNLLGSLTAANGLCLFAANDLVNGTQLWRSDGTALGTYALTSTASTIQSLHEFGGQLYFNGSEQLWRSDGTIAGTGLFAQLGGITSNPNPGVTVGNRFFFSAATLGITGREPYVSDGTVAGTYMIMDVNPGSDNSTGVGGIGFGGIYYWNAQDATTGNELWRTDGTLAGTWRVKDIRLGLFDSNPRDFCVSGGKLFFSADNGVNGKELWVSDGTEPGTQLVRDIYTGFSFVPNHITHLTDVDGTLFFNAEELGTGGGLWTSDGTTAGTQKVVGSLPLNNAFSVGGAFFFTATGSSVGNELFRSDGTAAGTVPVFDLWPGSGFSSPSDIVIAGDLIYFAAADPTSRRELFAMQLCELQLPDVYCTPGTTASGCQAGIGATGIPSASSPSGYVVDVVGAEGDKDGLFFFGPNGRQANPWGSSTSYQCVVPPVKRSPVQPGGGTGGACDGAYLLDFNTLITASPNKAPAVGDVVQIQCWFRDPFNTSNQTTSFSDALEFTLCP